MNNINILKIMIKMNNLNIMKNMKIMIIMKIMNIMNIMISVNIFFNINVMRHSKLVHQSQSQIVQLSPPIFGQLFEKLIFCFPLNN